MRTILFCCSLTLLATGCTPDAAERSGFGTSEADLDEGVDAGLGDPELEGPDGDVQDDEEDVNAEPEEPIEDPMDPYAWAMPPEGMAAGSRMEATLVCGFFHETVDRTFGFDGEVWREDTPDNAAGRAMKEGTEHCLVDDGTGDKLLDWYVDTDDLPVMYLGGGLNHDLRPTAIEGLWDGRVYPTGTPSEACLDALEEHGLTLPVTLAWTVTRLAVVTE